MSKSSDEAQKALADLMSGNLSNLQKSRRLAKISLSSHVSAYAVIAMNFDSAEREPLIAAISKSPQDAVMRFLANI